MLRGTVSLLISAFARNVHTYILRSINDLWCFIKRGMSFLGQMELTELFFERVFFEAFFEATGLATALLHCMHCRLEGRVEDDLVPLKLNLHVLSA